MDISYEEAVIRLELGTAEKRLHTAGADSVSLQIRRPNGNAAVVKFRSSGQVNALVHLTTWVTDTHTQRRNRGDEHAEDSFDPLAAILEEYSRQDEAARKGGGAYVTPLEATGHILDQAYSLRAWHAYSLQQLIDGNVKPQSSDDLFYLVHDVWSALCFLHQARLNVPHGNLKPANVLLDEQPGGGWKHVLTDMQMRSETDYVTAKQQDMQALGMLIIQYCESRASFTDWMAADECARGARWDFLCEHQAAWKKLARQLLTPEHYTHDYDPEVDRHQQLRPLRPKGYQLAVVPPPQQVGTTVRSSLVEDRLRQVRKQVEADEWMAAVEELCRLEEQCREGENARQRPDVMSVMTLAVDSIPAPEQSPHALPTLQRAAQAGSALAAYRLGDHYRHSDPTAARRQLARAAELGMPQAYILLGEMYLAGAPGQPPDVSEAARNFEDAIRLNDLPEAKFRLATLILKGDTFHRQEKAIEYLKEAKDAGVPGATGLLALCHATGTVVPQDMHRAYKLFQEAWQESEDLGQPDYTALNNLAVCIAHGFGVPHADLHRALRQIERAAEHGCRGAQRNLERLPRRIFLEA